MLSPQRRIEPCPYCGTAPIIDSIPTNIYNDYSCTYYLFCPDPYCRVASPNRISENRAVKTWNSMANAIKSSLDNN